MSRHRVGRQMEDLIEKPELPRTMLEDLSWWAGSPPTQAMQTIGDRWASYPLNLATPLFSEFLCLSLPIDRYAAAERKIVKLRKSSAAAAAAFSVAEILEHIHRFYTAALPKEELEAVAKTDDVFGYAERARIALKDGTVLYREQVMGDCLNFEKLTLLGAQASMPLYYVHFGS